ncbi:MAG: hypothetical protein J6S67_24455 [Methanobrevibacter sp.]|nr:hypothetical protein [Methanobrevibacter sp.]
MKVLVFAKKRQTKDGRAFTAYVTKLPRKDGTELTAGVKFREECGAPTLEECPCYVMVDKKDANLATKNKEITDEETGEIRDVVQYTLWVSKWSKSPEEYVDHSLDDFED